MIERIEFEVEDYDICFDDSSSYVSVHIADDVYCIVNVCVSSDLVEVSCGSETYVPYGEESVLYDDGVDVEVGEYDGDGAEIDHYEDSNGNIVEFKATDDEECEILDLAVDTANEWLQKNYKEIL